MHHESTTIYEYVTFLNKNKYSTDRSRCNQVKCRARDKEMFDVTKIFSVLCAVSVLFTTVNVGIEERNSLVCLISRVD